MTDYTPAKFVELGPQVAANDRTPCTDAELVELALQLDYQLVRAYTCVHHGEPELHLHLPAKGARVVERLCLGDTTWAYYCWTRDGETRVFTYRHAGWWR